MLAALSLSLLLVSTAPPAAPAAAAGADPGTHPFVGGAVVGGVALASTIGALSVAVGAGVTLKGDAAPMVALTAVIMAPLVTGVAAGVVVGGAAGPWAGIAAGAVAAVADAGGFYAGIVVVGGLMLLVFPLLGLSPGGEGVSLPFLLVTLAGGIAGSALAPAATTTLALGWAGE